MGVRARFRRQWARWKRWALPTKIGIVLGILGVLGVVLTLAIAHWPALFRARAPVPMPPAVQIRSSGVNGPSTGATLTFAQIQSRRLHVLSVSNPNAEELTNFVISIQFPEAIISIQRHEAAPPYELKAEPKIDQQPLTVFGPPAENARVEGFGEALSGIWRATVSRIGPHGAAAIDIITTSEQHDWEPYNAWASEARASPGELLWLVEGSYQYQNEDGTGTSPFVAPLDFEQSTRTFHPRSVPGDAVRVRQGRGMRIPGVLRAGGYLLAETRGGKKRFMCPVMLERLDISFKCGLFGPAMEPGIQLQFIPNEDSSIR